MPYLIDLDKSDEQQYIISPSPYDIFKLGRANENVLVLDEPSVSQFHAQIRSANLRYWIEDLQSETGTWINGTKIATKLLEDGDTLRIGSQCKFQFLLTDIDKKELSVRKQYQEPAPVKTSATAQVNLIQSGSETMADTGSSTFFSQVDDSGQVLIKYELDLPQLTIGRSAENAIFLDHKTVSRKHCELKSQNGVYTLTDLGSSNGTKVNGTRITQQRLTHGAVVHIGYLQFKFSQISPAENTRPGVKVIQPSSVSAPEPPKPESKTMPISMKTKQDRPLVLISIILLLFALTVFLALWSLEII